MTATPLGRPARALTLATLFVATASLAQSSGVAPGQWEMAITIQSMEMPGMPAAIARMMVGKTTKVKHCISPEEAARGPQDLMKSAKGCTFTRYSMTGGKLASEMVCKQGGTTTISVSTGSFTQTGFTAQGRSVTTGGPTASTVTASTIGRRIGDCGK